MVNWNAPDTDNKFVIGGGGGEEGGESAFQTEKPTRAREEVMSAHDAFK